MFRAATLVIFLGFGVRFAPSLPGMLFEPELWVVSLAVAWLWCGPAWAIAIMTTAWSVLNLGWALDDRLDPALVGQDIIVTGTICDFPRDDGRSRRFVLQLAPDATGPRLPARLYLGSYGALEAAMDGAVDGELAGGQRWRLKVRLKRPRGLSNPGAFDFERWALGRRIGATGYVRPSAINRRLEPGAMSCPLMRPRQFLATAIESAVGTPGPSRFLLALAVGARHRLTNDDWTLLRRTGTVHLMAISGLHIGLIAALMLWIGRALAGVALLAGLRCSPVSVGRMFALTGAILYAAMAGFTVPTSRALVMVVVGLWLATARRTMGGWQILGAAVIAVTWVDPFAMLSSGFWLSFGAVGVLMLAGLTIPGGAPSLTGFLQRWANRLRVLVYAQLSLSLGLAPLAMLFFSEVSVIAPLTNLLIVPVFAFVLVPLTLLGTVCVLVAPFAAGPLLGAAATLLDSGLAVLTSLADWPGSIWRQAPPGVGWVAATCVGTLALIWPRPLRLRLLGAVPIVAVAFGLAARPVPPLRIVVMDVGQGLAVLVQTPDHALLYDAGPAFGNRDAGQTVVLPVLGYFGVTALDAVVVSHSDNDHIGGMRSVLAVFPDATLIATESFGLSAGTMTICKAGLHWQWNGVRFQVLHPGSGAGKALAGDNDRSCVLSVSTPAASFLLPGDIERRAESRLISNPVTGQYDIVIAPHHGSATSSSPPFVTTVSPRIVVFTTGFANRWGFPKDPVQERWRAGGACLLDTAMTGALVFEAETGDSFDLVRLNRAASRHAWTEGELPPGACESGASTN